MLATPAREAPAEAPSPPGPPVVELERISIRFGDLAALDGVTLAIRAGERVAVVGPSGAGKSTLLSLLNTSLAPGSGRIRILGQDPALLPPRRLRELRARVGTVHQQLHLVSQASVMENVLMGRLGSRPAMALALAPLRARERAQVAALLAEVGLADRLDERVDRLSGGEQQRVAVARLLYQAPEVILADEPFASVDPRRAAAVVELLLRAAAGRALVLSTHQLDPVLPYFRRVVGLRGGRVLFDRMSQELSPDDLARLYQPESATASPEPPEPLSTPPALARAPLAVGASTAPGEYLLPRLAAAFVKAHPQVHLRLEVKDTDAVLEDLVAGRVELAFVGARRADPALHFEDFAEDEIVLVVAAESRLAPARPVPGEVAARLPRVDRERGSATRAIVEAQLEAMGLRLDPDAAEMEVTGVEALKAAVEAGVGVGFASRLSVEAELRSGRLRVVPVEGLRVPRRFFAAWRRDAGLSAGARAFLAVVRGSAGAGEAR